jgi:hypothetical protein
LFGLEDLNEKRDTKALPQHHEDSAKTIEMPYTTSLLA